MSQLTLTDIYRSILLRTPDLVGRYQIDMQTSWEGGNGCVFRAGANQVVKLTRLERERRLADMLMPLRPELGDYEQNLPKIEWTEELPPASFAHVMRWDGKGRVFLIIRDDIPDADFDDEAWWDTRIHPQLNSLTWQQQPPPDRIRELGRDLEELSREARVTEGDMHRLQQGVGLIAALAEHRIYLSDMRTDNWGEREGVLIARDIGCVSVAPSPPSEAS